MCVTLSLLSLNTLPTRIERITGSTSFIANDVAVLSVGQALLLLRTGVAVANLVHVGRGVADVVGVLAEGLVEVDLGLLAKGDWRVAPPHLPGQVDDHVPDQQRVGDALLVLDLGLDILDGVRAGVHHGAALDGVVAVGGARLDGVRAGVHHGAALDGVVAVGGARLDGVRAGVHHGAALLGVVAVGRLALLDGRGAGVHHGAAL